VEQTIKTLKLDPLQNKNYSLPKGDRRHWWNWVKDEDTNTRTLYISGAIAEESWFDDDITPKVFKGELEADTGDIVIWLNSPGGDCIAASQIYAMLMDYPYKVTIKVDGMAASAASVVAMAGTTVLMAPTSMMMIHNPLTVAIGDSEEMQKAIEMLKEVKESIINAYEIKTSLSRAKISHLMDAETWMNANKAIELGFADGILEDEKKKVDTGDLTFAFSRRAVTNCLYDKIKHKKPVEKTSTNIDVATATPVDLLEKRLSLITH